MLTIQGEIASLIPRSHSINFPWYKNNNCEVEPGNETKRLLPLTHGLILGADGGGVVQDKNVSLELPAGRGFGTRVNHDHTFPDLVPADLWVQQKEKQH